MIMNPIATGALIRRLRTEQGLTQRQLAETLSVCPKTVSKWESGKGCPDVSLLPPLAARLGVTAEALMEGELVPGGYVRGNLRDTRFFLCPVCGNLTLCTGSAVPVCCGRRLTPLPSRKAEPEERLTVETVEDEWFVSSAHPMTKEHYVPFVAFVTGDKLQLYKLFPEWPLQLRLPRREHGTLLWAAPGVLLTQRV